MARRLARSIRSSRSTRGCARPSPSRCTSGASAAIAAYWNALIFSGRELPPLEKATDADVIAYVRATPGAIGYVSAGADIAGVKLLAVEWER